MPRSPRRCLLAAAVAAVFGLTFPASAQVARVLDSRGAAVVERTGAAPRILGVGEPLDPRDTINVARDSWAMLEFADQTRVTLRPNTVFRIDAYNEDAPGSVLLGLVKGGLRAVTGLVAKRNPRGVQFQTAVATIGVRGTEFDARLCEDDCAAEENARPPAPATTVVARVIELEGNATAARLGGPPRLLVPGANLYEGDRVDTANGARAVVGFVDGTRLALGERSRAFIDVYAYDERRPENNRALLRLAAGAVTVETGSLAKLAPGRYEIATPRGTLRPRGTTFSVVMRPAAAVAQTAPTGSSAPTVAATPAQQATVAQGAPASTAAPAQTTPTGKPTAGAGTDDGSAKTQASPPPQTTPTTTGMAATPGQQAAVAQGAPTSTAAPAQTTPTGKPTAGVGTDDGGGKTQTTPPPQTAPGTTGMAATPAQQAAVAQGAPTSTAAPAQTTPTGKPTAGAATTTGGGKTQASPPPQSTTAEALPGVSTGAAVVTSSGPGATIGTELAASAVPTPVRQLLAQMIGRINLNADQTVASVRQAQSITDPGILRLTGARDPQTYDINLRQLVPGANAGQLLASMREWHAALTTHPVYGPAFAGLALPDLTDTSDPARLGALVESWFLRIDEHPALGRGFESIDTSGVFAGQTPARATPTTAAVATTRSLPTESPGQPAGSGRRAQIAQAAPVSVPVDPSTLAQPAVLGSDVVTLLGRMESSMERTRFRAMPGTSLVPGGSTLAASYQAISLPSFTPGMSAGDALRTFQQWREIMLAHPEYGPALQGLPAATLADLQDPARTAALLQQWYGIIGNTPLGDQFAGIDTSAVFTGRLVAKPDPGVAGATAGSAARGVQSGESGPQVDALGNLPIAPEYNALFAQLAIAVTSGSRTAANVRDSPGLAVSLDLPRPPLDTGAALRLLQSWYTTLTANPNYRAYIATRLPEPRITDTADPARFQALMQDWFTTLGQHPVLGSAIGDRSIMGRSYDWLFADEIVTVASGAVDVVTQAGTTAVGSGEAVRISGGGATSAASFVAADPTGGAAPGRSKPDPSSLDRRSGERAVTPGLYVWVRDGAVQVTTGSQAVDVTSGSAVLATTDAVALLDTVPGFLRFDTTPRPTPAGGGNLIDNFRATDGSTQHMCRVR